jgi:hypothetical protein
MSFLWKEGVKIIYFEICIFSLEQETYVSDNYVSRKEDESV